MFKLLTMLVTFLMVALMLLSLRQRRLELTSESSAIYGQIRDRHETLLGLHADIAKIANAWSLADTWKRSGMNTGGALDPRRTSQGRSTTGVETDLIAPLRGNP